MLINIYMKQLFWKLAKKHGAESLTNIFTGQQYLHRVYFLGPKLIKGVAGMYSDSRVCLNYFKGSDLPFEHNHPWGYFTLFRHSVQFQILQTFACHAAAKTVC